MDNLSVVLRIALLSTLLFIGCGRDDHEPEVIGVSWAKSYGGPDYDYARSVQQTSDGGYVVAGTSSSFGTDYDLWALKLKSDGTVSWQKRYSGAKDDYVTSIQQTSDGRYIIAGYTDSFGAGNSDFLVLKLESDGTISWQKAYGGAGDDLAYSIQETKDAFGNPDGYIVAGYTDSSGAGGYDFWVLKLDRDGIVSWQKTYGDTGDDCATSIQQTSDGGYIVAGYTTSSGAGYADFWVLKLESDGDVSWQKLYGGTDDDYAYSIQQTSDGGYIVAGHSSSFGAAADFWVLKLESDGDVSWERRYGGAYWDYAYSIQQTTDDGYIVAGYTHSFGGGNGDFWVLKLESDGDVSWQKLYGGPDWGYAYSVRQMNDGGYIVAGQTHSFGDGSYDFWVLKLNTAGTISFDPATGAYVINTFVAPVDTTASVANTVATVADTLAAVTDTDAEAEDTDATIQQQAPPLSSE